jgi:hypothetical protein
VRFKEIKTFDFFLGAFEKRRETTISFVMEQTGSLWTGLMFEYFSNLS